MTPQQYTANVIIQIIRNHPNGLTVDELLRQALAETENKNVPLYLGYDRNLASFLRDLESKNLLRVVHEHNSIIIQPTSDLNVEPVQETA